MAHRKWVFLVLMLSFFFGSCKSRNAEAGIKINKSVKDSVSLMMVSIAGDLDAKGPVAWLDYFENSPDFFMASDGGIAFTNYASAKLFIAKTLVKSIRHIDLHWDHLRVDPLATSLAYVGADFHENLTDSSGKILPEEGYFTALAEQTHQGWRLRNAHWSIIKHRDP